MNNQKSDIVFGYGITGKSIVQYLVRLNRKITLIENKPISPRDLFFLEQHHIQIFQDEKQFKNFHNYDNCYVSPGIDLRKPFFKKCVDNHIQLRNDTYFLNQIDRTKTKLIAVTGTNGKTTFCTLLHEFFIKHKLNSKLVGNVGTPILDLFFSEAEQSEFIIIELSSYQIELLKEETRFDFGVILNIEPDHLDRYDSFESYRDTKISLKNFCDVILFDKESVPIKSNADTAIPLGIDENYILQSWDAKSFQFKHQEKQYRIDTPYLKGIHNIKNILYIIKLLERLCKSISLEK
ncbi:MAG: Mur ligase family protein, partial [Methylophilaceae bacterium]